MSSIVALARRVKAEKAAAAAASATGGSSAAPPASDVSHTDAAGSSPAAIDRDAACDVHLAAEVGSKLVELGTPLPRVRYAGDALSPDAERALLAWTDAQSSAWVALRARRLQMWGGIVSARGLADPTPLPGPLAAVASELVAAGVFDAAHTPNHVLVNEYLPGQGGLGEEGLGEGGGRGGGGAGAGAACGRRAGVLDVAAARCCHARATCSCV
jgi:hypothetical protein